jgi:hypothetical protein
MLEKAIDQSSIQFENIYSWDAPDYVDAFISSAAYIDGTELTESELEELNSNSTFVHKQLQHYLY